LEDLAVEIPAQDPEKIQPLHRVDLEPVAFDHLTEGLRVVPPVVTHGFVQRPEEWWERRNEHDQPSTGRQDAPKVANGALVVLDVLEDIAEEHRVQVLSREGRPVRLL